MRWRIFRNTLRSGKGAAELGATIVAHAVYTLMGLGLAAGLGGGAYAVAASEKWIVLALLFWIVLVLWQVLPVSLASFQEQFDPGVLLRFPVSFGSYLLLHIIFGLVDVSSILGLFCCAGIWIGITVRRPDLAGWLAIALLFFAIFNIVLVRGIFAWIDRWLAQRRSREIVTGLFLALLLAVQLLNPAFHRGGAMGAAKAGTNKRALAYAERVQVWFPPGLAWQAVENARNHRPGDSAAALGGLGLYIMAAGTLLTVRLRAGYRGENLSDAPARSGPETRTRGPLFGGTGPLPAILEKELRTLLRSLPLLYGVGAPLFMVFVLSGVFQRRGATTGLMTSLGLMISLAYAVVGFTQLFYNNLGTEGPGVQLLFLGPTPVRTVFLAKNLFHAVLFALNALLVCTIASLRMGIPPPGAVAATASWILFALPVHLTVGNVFSLLMPYRINLGRMARQKGSQLNALLSMAVQGGVLGIGVCIFALFSYFWSLWAAVPVFLVLAAVAWATWSRVLARVDAIALSRRELLLGTLVKTD